jgi:hypothetical protein
MSQLGPFGTHQMFQFLTWWKRNEIIPLLPLARALGMRSMKRSTSRRNSWMSIGSFSRMRLTMFQADRPVSLNEQMFDVFQNVSDSSFCRRCPTSSRTSPHFVVEKMTFLTTSSWDKLPSIARFSFASSIRA